MTGMHIDLPAYIMVLDLFGTVAFAVAGVLAATNRELDLFGIIVAGTVTAIGGGTLRDLLLGRLPVFWVLHTEYLWLTFGASVLTFFFARKYHMPRRMIFMADAVGLSVFTVIGTKIALSSGVSPLIAVVTGVITGVFGGAVRDIFIAQVPLLFRRELYATPAFLGSVLFIFLYEFYFRNTVLICVLPMILVFCVRVYSVYKGLHLPRFLVIEQQERK